MRTLLPTPFGIEFPSPYPSLRIPNSFSSGEILNNQKSMEYNSQNGILSSSFNFMQLRRIKRNSDKKASEVGVGAGESVWEG